MLTRAFRGAHDLRLMQQLVSQAWTIDGPRVGHHVGGLAWSRYGVAGAEDEWRIRLWEESGRVEAWAWLHLPGTLEFEVHPHGGNLLGEILDWFDAETADADERLVWATVEDSETASALERRGYRRPDPAEPHFVHLIRALGDLPDPSPPPGFALRQVRGDELEARVALHRAAWHPSRVTVASHCDVTEAYPYRPELDCVVDAPDSSLASYCLAWIDEQAGVGELEPVGTDPRFAGHGLAKAVCLFALGQLRDLGAQAAVVYARGDSAYPAPRRLYESIGFEAAATTAGFRRAG